VIGHFLSRQFLLFLMVGGLAAFLHWLARIALSYWFSFSVAVVLAYCVGMAVAFSLNSLFVFPASDKPRHLQGRDFVLVNLAFLPVVWGASVLIERTVTTWGLPHPQAVAHGIAVLLPTLLTFLIYKFFAFKERTHERK
jgi:putative flippase GtrA